MRPLRGQNRPWGVGGSGLVCLSLCVVYDVCVMLLVGFWGERMNDERGFWVGMERIST